MSKGIKSISIIGSGNVAHHLGKAFSGQVKINSVYSRNKNVAQSLANDLFSFHAETIEEILPADLFLVCISDDAISKVIELLPVNQSIAYTSGSVGIQEVPKRKNIGVLYPLQTFSKLKEIELFDVPFFIEATNEIFAQDIFDLAWLVSRKVIFANSVDRKNLHLTGVFVNNFTNHIHFLAKQFLESKALEWNYLKPLIAETANKLQKETPFDSQTGPAVRNDQKTLAKHLEMLDGDTQNIYKVISDSILKNHQKI